MPQQGVIPQQSEVLLIPGRGHAPGHLLAVQRHQLLHRQRRLENHADRQAEVLQVQDGRADGRPLPVEHDLATVDRLADIARPVVAVQQRDRLGL